VNEYQLKRHIDKFASRGEYLLEVECTNVYAGIHLSDRTIALMLCETAQKAGVAKYIRLFRLRKAGMADMEGREEVVFEWDRRYVESRGAAGLRWDAVTSL